MSPDDFRTLVSAGLSTEQIAVVMEMMHRDASAYAAAEEARKSKGRERVAKWRVEHRNVTETVQKVTVPLTGADARGEDKPLPQKIEPQESKKEQSARDALLGVLDPAYADAVVAHRKFIRKPLSARAAGLIAKKLEGIADRRGAVDRMIERGWQTVYADENPAPVARGSPRAPQLSEVFNLIGQRAADEQQRETAKGGVGSRPLIPDLSIVRTG